MEAAATLSSFSILFSRPPVRFLASVSLPLLSNPRAVAPRFRNLCRSVITSCSADRVVARPSSELRRKHSVSGTEDEKLRALRELFSRPGIGIDAYIIPSQDAHQSEFIAECFMRRAYISGFTGSAGTAIVTKDKAVLWTDDRYFLQAEKELGPDWSLMRSGNPGVPTTIEWLNDVLTPGCRIGIDPGAVPFLFRCY